MSTAVVGAVEAMTATACGGGTSSPARAISVSRISGATAYGTAKAIAGATASATSTELADAELGSSSGHAGFGWRPTGALVVAQGTGYTDALCGAPFAAHQGSGSSPEPLVLTESPTAAGSALLSFLAQVGASGIDHDGHQVNGLAVLGGPLAVTGSVITAMEAALGR